MKPHSNRTHRQSDRASNRHHSLWRAAVVALLSVSVLATVVETPVHGQSSGSEAAKGALMGAVIGGVTGAVIFFAIGRQPVGVEPSRLDFSSVKVGDAARRVIELRNKTPGPMTVTALSISNDVFALVEPQVPFEIQPRGVRPLTLAFKPGWPGKTSATIDIRIAAPRRARPPHPKIPVRGEGIQ